MIDTCDADLIAEAALVERARNAAYAEGGRASLGVAETLEALADARVDHLVFDRDIDIAERATQNKLFAERFVAELRRGIDPLELTIEQALETSAKITPVTGRAAEMLREHEGMVALLRY